MSASMTGDQLAVAFQQASDLAKAGRHFEAEALVDRILAVAPSSFLALMLKADLLVEAGKRRTATSFYSAAARIARSYSGDISHIESEVQRAEQFCAQSSKLYEEFLREHLSSEGFAVSDPASRFGMSLDILFGRQQRYAQEPTLFYYPDIPTIQFYKRQDFPWVAGVESVWEEIRSELEGYFEHGQEFSPYLTSSSEAVQLHRTPLLDNPDWGALYLQQDSRLLVEHARAFPKTMEAFRHVPLCDIPGRTPSILFSLLRPGTHIPAHTGLLNVRLICHLPLIVPAGCQFRVGNQMREWKEGELLVFNDSIEHEAWNNSDHQRVILLFEVWRPELAEEERVFIRSLFQAIEAFDAHQ